MDEAALRRLRWRARRGLLENDLILSRFLAREADGLDEAGRAALEQLLELPDTELLDLLLARAQPSGGVARPEVVALLDRLRAA